MASIPFADNYLAGSLLTLLLPVCLLLAIAAWYMIAIRKVPKDTPASSPSLPPSDVVAAARQPTAQPESPATQPAPDSPRTEPPTTGT